MKHGADVVGVLRTQGGVLRIEEVDHATRATLDRLLQHNRERYAGNYGGGLSNHLSMGLVALARLGADAARLGTFHDAYAARLDATDVPSCARSEADANTRLSALAPHVGSAAFHGLIRVAYASMVDDAEELDAALDYFASEGPVPQLTTGGPEHDLETLAGALAAASIEAPPGTLITTRLADVLCRPVFQDVVARLAVDDRSLDRVSRFGARAWLTVGDFASLHVLTGAHAIRTLGPRWVDPLVPVRAAAVAALGCYVVAGCPRLASLDDLPVDDWETIRWRALASNDEHVCKLVLSCMDEAASTGDPIYAAVATRVSRQGEA